MYERFFGFRQSPFNLAPDPSFLYASRGHRVAFDALFYGITQRKGFCLLSGEVGTGKTLTCRALLAALDSKIYHTALLFNPYHSTTELLQAILAELGVTTTEVNHNKLLDVLYAFLLERARMGHTTILFLDEAQNFPAEVLEAVRLISNFETAHEKLVQIVLMGQPEIEEMLAKPYLRQLNQRIHVRARLQPLSPAETAEYIARRLEQAGNDGRVQFQWKAIEKIYKRTQGFPRLINILCDRVLLTAYVEERLVIGPRTVERAYIDLQGAPVASERREGSFLRRWIARPLFRRA